MWNKIGLGAAFLAVIASPVALHAVSAAPKQISRSVAPAAAATKSFVPVCKAAEAVDTRPDPAWVDASFAHDNCVAPALPAQLDGYTASREQIVAGMAAAKNFAARSDAYQRCISDFVASRKPGQAPNKLAEAALITIENHRIVAAQENIKKANALIAVAIDAFNEYGSECVD